MVPADMAAITMAVCKIDDPGKDELLRKFFGALAGYGTGTAPSSSTPSTGTDRKSAPSGVVPPSSSSSSLSSSESATTSNAVLRQVSGRDLGHLCCGFSTVRDRRLAKDFLDRIATPILLDVQAHSTIERSPGVSAVVDTLASSSSKSNSHDATFADHSAPVAFDESMSRFAHQTSSTGNICLLDANSMTRILNAYAKINAAQTDRRVANFLATSAVEWIPELYARELVNVALSFAKIRCSGVEETLTPRKNATMKKSSTTMSAPGSSPSPENEASAITTDYSAADTANQPAADRTSNGATTISSRGMNVFHRIRSRILDERLWSTFNAQDFANCLTAFCAYSSSIEGSRVALNPVIQTHERATASTSLAGPSSYSFSSDTEFQVALAENLRQNLQKMDLLPQHVASLTWSFGRKLDRFDLIRFLFDDDCNHQGSTSSSSITSFFPPVGIQVMTKLQKPQELVNLWSVLTVERPAVAAKYLLPDFTPTIIAKLQALDIVPLAEGYVRIVESGTSATAELCPGATTTISKDACTGASSFFQMLTKRAEELRHAQKLDAAQILFLFHAFCKIPLHSIQNNDNSPLLRNMLPDLRSLDANALALVLSGITHKIRLSEETAGSVNATVRGNCRHEKEETFLVDVCRKILGFWQSGRAEDLNVVANEEEIQTNTKVVKELVTASCTTSVSSSATMDFDRFIRLFYMGNKNVDRSVTNVLQSMAFLANNRNLLVAGSKDSVSSSRNATTFLLEHRNLISHLSQLLLRDSDHFSDSTLIQSIYACTQISEVEGQPLIPAFVRNRFLEKLSSIGYARSETLRAPDCVALVNTLVLCNHTADETLLRNVAARFAQCMQQTFGDARAPSSSSVNKNKKFAWQFLNSCARMQYRDSSVDAIAGCTDVSSVADADQAATLLSSLARLGYLRNAWVPSFDVSKLARPTSGSAYAELLFYTYLHHMWYANSSGTTNIEGWKNTLFVANTRRLMTASTGDQARERDAKGATTACGGLPGQLQTTREEASQVYTGLCMLRQMVTDLAVLPLGVLRLAGTQLAAQGIFENFSSDSSSSSSSASSGTPVGTTGFVAKQDTTSSTPYFGSTTATSGSSRRATETFREGETEAEVLDVLERFCLRSKVVQNLTTQTQAGPYSIDLCIDGALVT
ncbi:unnamed protein product [Amoebophrya sp. A25]|nr:unnamed protein product [Amoebophrya sp. A25]|eukprot:GSA25T00014192001.1